MTFFTADEISRFKSGAVRVALLVKMDFTSRTLGAWNGATKLTIDGVDYLPMYGAGQIEGLEFANSTTSEQITFSIAGVDDTILGTALSETGEVQDRLVTIFMQFFDDDWQPIAAAPAIFFGFMQPPEGAQTEILTDLNSSSPVRTINVRAENVFFNRSRAPGGRYSDRDQQYKHPGDKVFDFMPGLTFKTFYYPDY